jgi:glutamate-1-semialdehyde 2,1-aminomutase
MDGADPPSAANLHQSRALYERASRSLAGGVSTAFRMFERPVPLFIREAHGSRLVDEDGNDYIDYVAGYGPVILGHGNSAVAEAVARAAAGVQQVGAQHRAEVELAERLCELVPAFERVRLGLAGSDAVHAALRLARAATGRSLVIKFAGHYHGWLDTILTGTGHLPPGLPETAGQPTAALADVVVIDWNEPEVLRQAVADAGDRLAAVIMEALPCNAGVIRPRSGYLELARQLTRDAGALLVFDEVITGFRVAPGGAQELLGVVPDLAVVAKALGNGFPISAFGGRADVMEAVATNRAMHAGTFNGGGISVAAAAATLDVLLADGGAAYEHMRRLGRRLMDGLVERAAAAGRPLLAQGPGPVFYTWFTDLPAVESFRDHRAADAAAYARFAELMAGEGIRVIPAGRWYLTAAHTDDDVDQTLEAAGRALAALGG